MRACLRACLRACVRACVSESDVRTERAQARQRRKDMGMLVANSIEAEVERLHVCVHVRCVHEVRVCGSCVRCLRAMGSWVGGCVRACVRARACVHLEPTELREHSHICHTCCAKPKFAKVNERPGRSLVGH